MKTLTFAQVRKCELAVTKRCRCRCGGTLHGAARCHPCGFTAEFTRTIYEALPLDNPHRVRVRRRPLSTPGLKEAAKPSAEPVSA